MDLLVEAELKHALAAAGCPLCRTGEEAVQRYLRFILHESVNDPATRSRLARAWGFCRRHAWHFLGLEWTTKRDGLSTANLSEAFIQSVEEILDAYLRDPTPEAGGKRKVRAKAEKVVRALTPSGQCPACELQARHEAYALTVLLRALEQPAWRERFSRSDGFCLVHLRSALNREDACPHARWIVEDHRRRFRDLLRDLEEYMRKHDYRFSHEPYGRERDVTFRATEALAGTWFDLPRRPPAGDGREADDVEAKGGGIHG